MSLNAFTLRDTSLTHPDVELALSDLEKKLCKRQARTKGPHSSHTRYADIDLAVAVMCLMRMCSCLEDHKHSVTSEDQMLFVRLLEAVEQNTRRHYPPLD